MIYTDWRQKSVEEKKCKERFCLEPSYHCLQIQQRSPPESLLEHQGLRPLPVVLREKYTFTKLVLSYTRTAVKFT